MTINTIAEGIGVVALTVPRKAFHGSSPAPAPVAGRRGAALRQAEERMGLLLCPSVQ